MKNKRYLKLDNLNTKTNILEIIHHHLLEKAQKVLNKNKITKIRQKN